MKKHIYLVIIFAVIFSFLLSYTEAADETEYSSSTKILSIPKVKVDDQYVYDARLELNINGGFDILGYSNGPFTLSSSAISNGELLSAYKCEEKINDIEKSIPLSWSNVPTGTVSLAIMMHHFPNINDTTKLNSYLLLWNIDPFITSIAHGEADDGAWYMGSNKDGTAISYTSPCSQSSGTHEYTMTLYALSETPASLPGTSSLSVTYDVLKAAIDSVTIIGTTTLTFNDVTP